MLDGPALQLTSWEAVRLKFVPLVICYLNSLFLTMIDFPSSLGTLGAALGGRDS